MCIPRFAGSLIVPIQARTSPRLSYSPYSNVKRMGEDSRRTEANPDANDQTNRTNNPRAFFHFSPLSIVILRPRPSIVEQNPARRGMMPPKENMMDVVGMTFGIMGFTFALIAMNQANCVKKELRELKKKLEGILKE